MLDDILSDDAALAFCDTDSFGESVVFTPRSTGTARTIKALVTRHPPEAVGRNGVKLPRMEVSVRNHATLGILLTSLNTGGDVLSVAYRKGGTAEEFLVQQPHSQDSGMLTFWLD